MGKVESALFLPVEDAEYCSLLRCVGASNVQQLVQLLFHWNLFPVVLLGDLPKETQGQAFSKEPDPHHLGRALMLVLNGSDVHERVCACVCVHMSGA